MNLVFVCLLFTLVVISSTKATSSSYNYDHTREEDNIKEILADTKRRFSLKCYLKEHKLTQDRAQLKVWELCSEFLHFYTDLHGAVYKFDSIVDTIVNKTSGYCKRELRIPKEICLKVKNKNDEDYLKKVVLLKDTIASNLQSNVYFMYMSDNDWREKHSKEQYAQHRLTKSNKIHNEPTLKAVKNITDIMEDLDKRNLLKVYFQTNGFMYDLKKVEIWELCNSFIHIHYDMPDAKQQFFSIVKQIADRKTGACKEQLEIPKSVCKEMMAKTTEYIDRVISLKDAIIDNLQETTFEEFVKKAGWV